MYAKSRGGTPSRYRLDAEDFCSLPVPAVSEKRQLEIAELCEKRIQEAVELRAYAEAIWQQARERFEEQLLKGAEA